VTLKPLSLLVCSNREKPLAFFLGPYLIDRRRQLKIVVESAQRRGCFQQTAHPQAGNRRFFVANEGEAPTHSLSRLFPNVKSGRGCLRPLLPNSARYFRFLLTLRNSIMPTPWLYHGVGDPSKISGPMRTPSACRKQTAGEPHGLISGSACRPDHRNLSWGGSPTGKSTAIHKIFLMPRPSRPLYRGPGPPSSRVKKHRFSSFSAFSAFPSSWLAYDWVFIGSPGWPDRVLAIVFAQYGLSDHCRFRRHQMARLCRRVPEGFFLYRHAEMTIYPSFFRRVWDFR